MKCMEFDIPTTTDCSYNGLFLLLLAVGWKIISYKWCSVLVVSSTMVITISYSMLYTNIDIFRVFEAFHGQTYFWRMSSNTLDISVYSNSLQISINIRIEILLFL